MKITKFMNIDIYIYIYKKPLFEMGKLCININATMNRNFNINITKRIS